MSITPFPLTYFRRKSSFDADFPVNRLGYKKLMFMICALQSIGVVMEMATTNWIVFSSGRVITYLAVGFVESESRTTLLFLDS